ncbi:Uncharacterized protein GBIM_03593, partial [Gryllus bimaculatus]
MRRYLRRQPVLESPPGPNLWGSVLPNGSFSGGVMGALAEGRVEVAFANLWITPERLARLAMGPPLGLTCHTFAVRRQSGSQWLNVARPFEAPLWGAAAAACALVAAALRLLSAPFAPANAETVKIIGSQCSESLINALGIFLSTSCPKDSQRWSLRILVATSSYFALLLAAVYSSSLVSHLTAPSSALRIDTLEEMVKANIFWTARHSSEPVFDRNDPVQQKLISRWRPGSTPEARRKAVLDPRGSVLGRRLYGFFFINLAEFPVPSEALRGLRPLKQCVATFYSSVAFRKGSPLEERFRTFMSRSDAAGLSSLWAQRVMQRQTLQAIPSDDTLVAINENTEPLSLAHLSGSFFVPWDASERKNILDTSSRYRIKSTVIQDVAVTRGAPKSPESLSLFCDQIRFSNMEQQGDAIVSEDPPSTFLESVIEEGGSEINDEPAALSEKDLLFFNDHTDPETADFLRLLVLEGRKQPGDCGVMPDSKPSWVDDEKIRLGQQFAMKYYFGVVFANVVSELILFTLPGFVEPLVFTGGTASPTKAVRRYLSTLLRVNTWYTDDLWDAGSKARRNLDVVRGMHHRIRRDLRDTPREELARRSQLQVTPWAEGVADALRKDFSSECADLDPSFRRLMSALSQGRRVSQLEMALTQLSFVGVHVTCAGRVGAGGASEAELEGFAHLWRALGHLLGVEERFNVCGAGLDATRRRTRAALRLLHAP